MTRDPKNPDSLDRALSELKSRPHGIDPGWCPACWGKRIPDGEHERLTHQSWCPRRTG